jgi:Thaumatin family
MNLTAIPSTPSRRLRDLCALLLVVAPACSSAGVADRAAGAASGTGGSAPATSGTGGTHIGSGTGGSGTDAGNPDAGSSNLDLPRTIAVTNQCTFPVWADALPTTTFPAGAPVRLDPGQTFTAGVDNGWSGRVWGRFGCTSPSSKFACEDDPYPSTLAELTLTSTPGSGLDFYDISLVDGFDLPMALIAVGFTATASQPYSCGAPTCAMDLRPSCPQPLRDLNADDQTIVCSNDACKVIGMNDPSDPTCIYPNQYSMFFKASCPQAYSFPSDDPTSTFTCKGKDYHVVFCP